MVFRGTFEHALDAKHRLTVPAKFRPMLAGGVVLAASPEVTTGSPRTVSIWTPDGYEAFVAQSLSNLNPLNPNARELKRFYFNSAYDADLDAANRVMIPGPLLRYAELDKDVIVAGSGDCIEVWDRQKYETYQEDVRNRIPDIAASLGDTP